jgi:hypothetical protein
LLLTAEDDLGATVKPRLVAAGANLHNIIARKSELTLDDQSSGLMALDRHIEAVEPALVVIDPLVAYIGAKVDMYRANQVRELMTALAKRAEGFGVALVVVRHLRKGGGGKAIYAGAGSIDFTAAARSVLMVGTDAQTGNGVLVHIKCNVAKKARSLAYTLEGGFKWIGEVDTTADDLLSEPEDRAVRTATQDAATWLRERIAAEGGCIPSKVLEAELGAHDISFGTYKRARQQLKKVGLRAEQRPELGDGWFTYFAESSEERPGALIWPAVQKSRS